MAMARVTRGGPSGPRILPARAAGLLNSAAAGVETVTLLAAGHAAGFYQCSVSVFSNNALGTGTFTSAFGWRQPVFGPATLAFGVVNLNASGLIFQVTRTFESDGLGAITWVMTPAGVGGSPSLRISTSAQLLALPVG